MTDDIQTDNAPDEGAQLHPEQKQYDDHYFKIFESALDQCRDYKPRFGGGSGSGLTLKEFQTLYENDPFYHWIGLDSPLMYAAHKAAGGITSVYRQIGIACQRIFNQMVHDHLGLSSEEAAWSYVIESRRLSLDGRIEIDKVRNAAAQRRVQQWICDAGRLAGLPEDTLQGIKGCVFEVRQGYKSKDSKRQNADIANAANAYVHKYMPAIILFSTQIDSDVAKRYKERHWIILTGTKNGSSIESTYAFCRNAIGYDLANFFECHSEDIKKLVKDLLETLLSPEEPV
ncbi:hypothetical protein [Roseiflexus castenholzii]|jgi:hypothetical protein|uniref:Uncharacterized protein n=1 Tax=Roseiflexus castenholzii (strain DSM 13941 / HLO8) TaxID=383372 RepID=A7NHX3_ROSCS|nr:hypothetical protein [Roseiflexus castenholzii]ABU57070.1 hypothetical protein Rcas_0957 [Roseiflexus castenholzii DSM 13941]